MMANSERVVRRSGSERADNFFVIVPVGYSVRFELASADKTQDPARLHYVGRRQSKPPAGAYDIEIIDDYSDELQGKHGGDSTNFTIRPEQHRYQLECIGETKTGGNWSGMLEVKATQDGSGGSAGFDDTDSDQNYDDLTARWSLFKA